MADTIPSWLVLKYEGMVITTASKTAPYCQDDFEDICQIFRIAVWKALDSYDLSKVKNEQPDSFGRTSLDRYVFACVKNRAKDFIKKVKRDLSSLDELEEVVPVLVAGEDEVHPLQRDMPMLPSTLTPTERQVVTLLYLDFDNGEIAAVLNWRRQRVQIFIRSIREKMADWKPAETTLGQTSGPPPVRSPLAASAPAFP